jgi:hypothetical protein
MTIAKTVAVPAVTLPAVAVPAVTLPVFTALMSDKTFEYISANEKANKAKTLISDLMYAAGIRSAHLVCNKAQAEQTELYNSVTASICMGLIGKKSPDLLHKILTSEKLTPTEAKTKRTVSMGVSAYRDSLIKQLDNRAKAAQQVIQNEVEADRAAKLAEIAANQEKLAEQARAANVKAVKEVIVAAKKGDSIALKEAQGKALQAKANVVKAEVAAVQAVETSKAEKEKMAQDKLESMASGFTMNLKAILKSNITRIQDFEAPDFNAPELIKVLNQALAVLDVKVAVEKKTK